MKSGWKTRANPFLMREVQAIGSISIRTSIDTIELFFQKAPTGLRTRLEAAVGRRIRIQKCLDATGYQRGVRVILNRPNPRTLKVASHLLQANHSATLCREDIAIDFETTSEEAARALLKLLDRHLVLKWRSPSATKKRFDTTVYWTQGRPNRNLVIYAKAAQTIRLELRYIGSHSISRSLHLRL
jgi:hypothetical protein